MNRSVYLSFLFGTLVLQACTNSPDKADSWKSPKNKIDSTAIIENGDGEFLPNAVREALAEIELGKLAQRNSSNVRVRKFALMTENDHRTINEQLKALALSKNINVSEKPDEQYKKQKDHLINRKGPAFDLSYMKMMVKDHRSYVKQFRNAVNDAADPRVRSFARATLPVLQKHLDSAKAIYNSLKPPLDNVIIL